MTHTAARSNTRLLVSALQALLIVSVVGCSTSKLAETPAAAIGTATTGANTLTTKADKPASQSAVKAVTVHPLDDPKSALANRSVYFELDSAQVAAASTQLLNEHGNYLRTHSSAKIRLEGNADERGGREYNLALGQKRADAVDKALQLLGVAGSQLEAVSYGKEKPAVLGHDEASWAKNRRADMVYQTR